MTNRALLISNGTFAENSGLRNLYGPQHDIRVMHDALTHPDFGLFTAANAIVECSEKNTDDLKSCIYDFFRTTSRDDYVLIYFSGHGLKPADVLILAASNTTEDAAPVNGVPTSWINEQIRDYCKAERRTFILDCCYSGGAFAHKSVTDLKLADTLPGSWFLSSSTATTTSKDGTEGNPSPFTKALVASLVDPELSATSDDGVLTLDVIYGQIKKSLQPVPVLNQNAQGFAPIARRARPVRTEFFSTLKELNHLDIQDLEIVRTVTASPEEMVVVQHMVALLDLAAARSPLTGTYQPNEAIERAWSYVGKFLRDHGLDDDVLTELSDGISTNHLARLRLKFDDDDVAQLPWEYLELAEPFARLSAGPLALRLNLMIERCSTATSRLKAPTQGEIKEVALFGRQNGEIPGGVESAIREDLTKLNVGVGPMGTASHLTFGELTFSSSLPTVLLVTVAMRSSFDSGKGCRIDMRCEDEWIEMASFVENLKYAARGVAFRAIMIETFASAPAEFALEATMRLARSLAEEGIGNVVFVCHPPAFPGYPAALPHRPLRTFVGYLISALNTGATLPRASYLARLRMQSIFVAKCARIFGVPGLYEPEFTSDDLGRSDQLAGSAAAHIARVPDERRRAPEHDPRKTSGGLSPSPTTDGMDLQKPTSGQRADLRRPLPPTAIVDGEYP